MEALRQNATVEQVDVSNAGTIYVVLQIPPHLTQPPRRTEIGVEERRSDKGDLEINFWTHWIGPSGSAEYRSYVEKTAADLRDRTIERCGSN
jgi:hypothetical protein